ncbi:MAG: glycerol-3-phosphate dehydrogenase/oxidase [Nitrospirota bacterium]|nr:glycerol-3-phosphate dehydrogenase/oxidase [Nitrospirota bacterium]
MMRRDFSQLEEYGPFDVLVVGGGIYGAWIAQDAALRGLRVALVERTDWGAGTSQASSKLLHGGLRYLEHFKFGLVQRALLERRRLAELAPHRVHPLRFAIPVYRGDRVGRLKMEAGLWLYDRLAGGKQPVPPHRMLSRKRAMEDWPFLGTEGLVGGFTYGDCGTDDARFTLEVVAGAMVAGAVCVNHAEAVELVMGKQGISGAMVHDALSGRTSQVMARVTVNAAGPWGGNLKGMRAEGRGLARLVKGVHLVLPALPVDDAFLLTARRDGRVFFLIPWYGRTLVGTTDTDYSGDPGEVTVTPEDIEYLLTEAGRVLGANAWTESDVLGSFAGVRTLINTPGTDSSPTDVTREWTLESPQPGLLMPVGGKLTSARVEAAITVQHLCSMLDRAPGACPTRRRPFAWAPRDGMDYADWEGGVTNAGTTLGLDPATARQSARRLGNTLTTLHQRLREAPDLARRIHPDLPFCMGEAVHAASQEMAVTLDDVLRRRVPLAILARLTPEQVVEVADHVAPELGWTWERAADEATGWCEQHGIVPRS